MRGQATDMLWALLVLCLLCLAAIAHLALRDNQRLAAGYAACVEQVDSIAKQRQVQVLSLDSMAALLRQPYVGAVRDE